MAETIESRLRALGLEELIASMDDQDLPYPLPKKRILRLLEVSATKHVKQATEIMKLHREILEGTIE